MDFTASKCIGQDINQVMQFKGYDHYYLVKSSNEPCIIVSSESRKLSVFTDCFGFQFYTGD